MLSKSTIFIASLGLILFGCARDHPVTIVIPQNFRGEVLIMEDPKAPALVQHNGVYVCEIPKTGRLYIKDISLLVQFHTETYKFKDGTSLNSYVHPARSNHEELAAFGGGYYHNGGNAYPSSTIRLFVGLTSEATKWILKSP